MSARLTSFVRFYLASLHSSFCAYWCFGWFRHFVRSVCPKGAALRLLARLPPSFPPFNTHKRVKKQAQGLYLTRSFFLVPPPSPHWQGAERTELEEQRHRTVPIRPTTNRSRFRILLLRFFTSAHTHMHSYTRIWMNDGATKRRGLIQRARRQTSGAGGKGGENVCTCVIGAVPIGETKVTAPPTYLMLVFLFLLFWIV